MEYRHLCRVYALKPANVACRFLFIACSIPIIEPCFDFVFLFTALITYATIMFYPVTDVVYRSGVLVTLLADRSNQSHNDIYKITFEGLIVRSFFVFALNNIKRIRVVTLKI